jgi:hypothetical protein
MYQNYLLENTCMEKHSPTKPLYVPNVKYCILSQQAIFFTTSDILIELFYNVNISARIHPPLKQITPLKS